VLKTELPWLENVVSAKRPARLPVVLTKEEVRRVLAETQGTSGSSCGSSTGRVCVCWKG